MAIWEFCESELEIDVPINAPQTENALDCALIDGEMAEYLLAAFWEQELPELADEIAPNWDLPAQAVQRGLETILSYLEQVQGSNALLYEMA